MKYFLLFAIIFTFLQGKNPISFIKNIAFQWPLIIVISFGIQIALAIITIETNKKFELVLILTFLGIIVGLWRNRTVAGIRWILTGAVLNLAALILHDGLMPVSDTALSLTGQNTDSFQHDSRHQLMDHSMQYWVLGDWIPVVRYVLSPGDFLVGLGIIFLVSCNSSKRQGKGEGK